MPKRNSTPAPLKRQAKKLSLAQKSFQKERRALQHSEEREFRHNVSKLKKLGVAFTRSTPKTKKSSSKSKGIIETFRDIIEGKAKVHKIGKTGASKYGAAKLPGIRTVNNRIIVPVEPGTATYVRGGNLYRKRVSPQGEIIQRTQVIPVAVHSTSLQSFIDNLRDDPDLERSLKKGNYWSFRYFGNNSYGTFQNLELLANYWEDYQSIQLALKEETENPQEYIEALEIFQIPKQYNPRDMGDGFKRYSKRYERSAYAKSLYQRDKIRNPQKHEAEKEVKRLRALEQYHKFGHTETARNKKRAADKARYAKGKQT